ncbi:50S ribosomal protein L21e [Candidatus Pacearchaeota archaeon]|nr:50S ribosomal protein L21e [Candidatus Pacearchaeota archaeon]
MTKTKNIREKGKVRLSQYFQDLKKGDRVSVVLERSSSFSFPERLQGRTGVIENKRGVTYLVKIKDQAQEKKFLIRPIHLKKVA